MNSANRRLQIQNYYARKNSVGKPPKLRARPGEIYKKKGRRKKTDKDHPFWCVKFAFRLRDDPSVWLFVMEERASLEPPDTPLSILCNRVDRSEGRQAPKPVEVKPFRSGYDAMHHFSEGDYAHGDRITITTQELLNQFELVSSGTVS